MMLRTLKRLCTSQPSDSDEGESIDALSKQGPAPAGAAAVRPPDENGFLWIDQDGFAKTSAVVVHGCDGRPDDSAASRGIYGKENGCHGPQSSCGSCSHGLPP